MKIEDLNKARHIIHLIKEYKYFLEVKRKCWGELKITRLETNYILRTAYGFLSKEIKADEILSGLITDDLVARAWLDGYEVEEEKRYTVVVKATKQPLYYNAVDKKLFFSDIW